jgi:capsular exopolysaccharide synthesis family protein
MGLIPVLTGWRDKSTAVAVSLDAPESRAAESYRSLRASIQFLAIDKPIKTLQITSPASMEGKTTTLVNLAIALAQAGQEVVVVDCDLRRPRVHDFFHFPAVPGFTSVLLGDLPLTAALRSVDGLDSLRVLTAGSVPPNPSELLSGHRTLEIFDALRSICDIVLIDSPPLLPVSDGAVIAARVDATLILVNDTHTRRKQVLRALEVLRQVDGNVIGTILNRMAKPTADYGSKYYGYRPYVADVQSSNGKSTSDLQETPGP